MLIVFMSIGRCSVFKVNNVMFIDFVLNFLKKCNFFNELNIIVELKIIYWY